MCLHHRRSVAQRRDRHKRRTCRKAEPCQRARACPPKVQIRCQCFHFRNMLSHIARQIRAMVSAIPAMCRLLAPNRGQVHAMTLRQLLPNLRSLSERLSNRPEGFSGGQSADMPSALVPPLRPRVDIPVCDPGPDAEAATRLRARGQFLARQDDWDRLAQEIREAESARALTPGLFAKAALLAEGARTDIKEAVRQAVAEDEARAVRVMLASLEVVREDMPDCPVIALVLALAHVDAAQAWRGTQSLAALPDLNREEYARHMASATALNDLFDPFEHDSPLWATVRCAVLEADPHPRQRVADDYEDLIDLDPGNPHHLSNLGRNLRPSTFGTWEQLDQQARRTAARTADVWGVGGYVWVYYGALCADAGAYRRLDAELFVEGLHDILARHGSQDMVNRLAAFAGLTLGGPADPASARRRIADCLGWIAQDHLREVHPMIWADAALPPRPLRDTPEDTDPIRRGRMRAISSLAEFYAPALDTGRRLVFEPEGMRITKGD